MFQNGSKLVGTGTTATANQGSSLAISGDGNTIVVGEPSDASSTGSVLIFVNVNGAWTQQGSPLVGTGAVGTAVQGVDVAISGDGNTIIVGGPNDNSGVGAAWIFTRSGGVWTQQGSKLVGSGAVGNANQAGLVALSADGNTAAIGGPSDNSGAGAVWIFTRSGGVWTQQGSKLTGTGASGNALQGSAVALSASGDTLLFGGQNDNEDIGAAWVFTRSAGVWTQQGGKLSPPDAAGNPAFGFFASLSADGNTALIGGPFDQDVVGAAWIYNRVAGTWSETIKLSASDATGGPNFGWMVSLNGDGSKAAIGGINDSSGAGATWIFTYNGISWTQQGNKLVGTGAAGATSNQGNAVALSGDGNTLAESGPGDNGNAGATWIFNTGAVYRALNLGQSQTNTLTVQFTSGFTLGGIGVVTQGLSSLDFFFQTASSNACSIGTSYSSGDTCEVGVRFSPTAAGVRTGALQFFDDESILQAQVYVLGTGLSPQAVFTNPVINTIAGNGTSGFSGDGGPASSAEMASINGMAIDAAGNLFLADSNNNRVRRIDANSGLITTFAGNGSSTFSGDGGQATTAGLDFPFYVAFDGAGNLYIAESDNRVRMVSAVDGSIVTVAGTGGRGDSGDGGPATSAQFNAPYGISVDTNGNLYIMDSVACVVRYVSAATGIITTIAGTGTCGHTGDGGPAIDAQLNGNITSALDSQNNLYFSDDNDNYLRRIDAKTGIITSIAGNGTAGYTGDGGLAVNAEVNDIEGITTDAAGDVIFTDSSNNVVRMISAASGIITTIAGNGNSASTGDGGPALMAGINYAVAPVIDANGDIFVADWNGHVIREISGESPLVFPNTAVSGISTALTASVVNTGTGPFTVSSLHTSSSNFAVDPSSTTCSGNVPSGAKCAMGVLFTPTTSGLLTDHLSFNLGLELPSIGLSGIGVTGTTTTTAVVAAPNPATTGQTVTLTATVSPASTDTPAGSIIFMDGSTAIGMTNVNSSGVGTMTTSSLATGSHSITAVYSGSATFSGSTSSAVTLVINGSLASTSTALTAAPNPATVGQTVTFTATVTPHSTDTPPGSVNFKDGSTSIGSGNVNSSGVATFTSSSLTAGSHSITAVYSGSATFSGSTSSVVTLVINAGSTSTSTALTVAPNPATAGQIVTFTATVTPHSTDTPPGSVNFMDGSTSLGSVAVNASTGVASVTSSSLTSGSHSITAVYSGSASFAGSTSSVVTLVINASLTTTSTSLTATPNPATAGQTVTFTATITPHSTDTPPGSVNFKDGATSIGSANVNSSGVATFTLSSLAAGSHSITAVYSGSTSFAGSTSSAVTLVINAGATATTTTLSISPNPATFIQTITLTATIAPHSTDTPPGAVNFMDGSTSVGIGSLNTSGVATFSVSSLTPGTHSITAVYSGSASFASSTSSALSLVVSAAGTATTLSVSPTSPVDGQPTILTATIVPAPTGSNLGSVNFFNGATQLGSGTVNSSGVATFSTSTLPAGSLSLTAVFAGTTDFSTSTSAPDNITVAPGYNVTTAQSSFTVSEGGAVMIPVTVPPLGGAFNNVVTMSVTGLPPGATATFTPPSVTPGATGAPTVLSIQLRTLAAANTTPRLPYKTQNILALPVGLVTLILLAILWGFVYAQISLRPRQRRFRLVAVAGTALAAVVLLNGCSGGFNGVPITKKASYTVVITGTSGALHVSTSVTVAVQ